LNHCMYRTFLREPRLHINDATGKCGASRNTVAKYWKEGLKKEKLFPPQLRLNMYKNRKEYIYLIQSDSAHKLYTHFQKQPDVIYISYTSGKFDLLLQTSKPLDVLPDRTVLHGSRGNYIFPDLTNCTYENALDRMETMLDSEPQPSKIPVEYPDEPPRKGSQHYGWMIYPYVKYDLRTGFTPITKKLHISFESFYKGINYLMNISTVLLPYYPLGFRLYSQYFLVFWSDYEKFLCEFFGCLPCHTSITKVDNALIVYLSTQNGEFLSKRLFQLCFRTIDIGLVDHFWSSKPVYYWKPDLL
jgi:hypothetical protein